MRSDRGSGLALRYLVAVFITAITLFPIYWLFMISFKTPEEIFAYPPVWWPESIQFANYAVLFKDGDVVTIWNSLVIATVSTLFAMVLGTMCAYSIARFRTGGNLFSDWLLSNRMVPPIVIVFPVFLLFVKLGLVDSFTGLVLLYTAF
ncbi:MAG TPA: carbohydrate ABC transporter permease, partial [Afifellaceae bacterium]|nr:carbohydrate ABC transporter permease [Afifellaceae bacterium]